MEQVFAPKINTPAIAGWCLKYIDDAGQAPNRTATARYAWEVERNAGRIRTDVIPENVWLVGWLDFTQGAYETYGHVFFIKRLGNTYQIYDSEVQSGKRKPYGSIEELLAWFGAYKPIYTGWSTHCDGREYAKLKKGVEMVSSKGVDYLFRVLLGRDADKKQKESLMADYTFDGLETWIMNLPEYKDKVKLSSEGKWDILNTLVYPYSKYKNFANGGYEEIKEKVYRKK